MKAKAVQGKQVPVEWTEDLGESRNGGTTHEFFSPFLCSGPPLEKRQKRREFYPKQAGKDPSSLARRGKRSSSGCGRDPRASSGVETGVSGNFLSAAKV